MKTKINDWDASEVLDSQEMITAYMQEALESGDQEIILTAIADIAKAQGMTEIAKKSGLSRQNLYRALSPSADPKFSTVQKVVEALGCRLSVVN